MRDFELEKVASSFWVQIRETTRARVAKARSTGQVETLKQMAISRVQTARFSQALSVGKPGKVIAEIKRASPSQGLLSANLDAVETARDYLAAGATAISVLTEPHFFGGAVADLVQVRAAFPDVPLLMKDFVLDSYQLQLAKAAGADAVLLMASFLEGSQMAELHAEAESLGLEILCEVHSAQELEGLLQLQPRFQPKMIGVNNRNLKTLSVDLRTSETLAEVLKGHPVLKISESGIHTPLQIRQLIAWGYQAFLIGTALTQNKSQKKSQIQDLLGLGRLQNSEAP